MRSPLSASNLRENAAVTAAQLADPNPVPEICMPLNSPLRQLLGTSQKWRTPLAFIALLLMATTAIAHGVAEDDAAFLKNSTGTHLLVRSEEHTSELPSLMRS